MRLFTVSTISVCTPKPLRYCLICDGIGTTDFPVPNINNSLLYFFLKKNIFIYRSLLLLLLKIKICSNIVTHLA